QRTDSVIAIRRVHDQGRGWIARNRGAPVQRGGGNSAENAFHKSMHAAGILGTVRGIHYSPLWRIRRGSQPTDAAGAKQSGRLRCPKGITTAREMPIYSGGPRKHRRSAAGNMTFLKQRSFASLEYAGKRRRTRREKFLGEMERVVPWQRLQALL